MSPAKVHVDIGLATMMLAAKGSITLQCAVLYYVTYKV